MKGVRYRARAATEPALGSVLLLVACVEAAPTSLDTTDDPLGGETPPVTTSLREGFEDTSRVESRAVGTSPATAGEPWR